MLWVSFSKTFSYNKKYSYLKSAVIIKNGYSFEYDLSYSALTFA